MADISNWKILIVDDDPGIRQILGIIFQMSGGQVVEASSGKEALVMLKSTRPTHIITDLDMPEFNGWQLLEAIRAEIEYAQIPVVAVSGDSSVSYNTGDNGARFTAVIPKPFNARTLVDELVEACS
jgi:CheY-like chemotaxis protein